MTVKRTAHLHYGFILMRGERSLKRIRNRGVYFIRGNWPSLMATRHLGFVRMV